MIVRVDHDPNAAKAEHRRHIGIITQAWLGLKRHNLANQSLVIHGKD